MDINLTTTPTALRSAFVAPALGGYVAGVCPQTGLRRVATDAAMATGYRSWIPLIT